MPKQGNHTGSALNLKSLASSSAHHNTRDDKQNNNLLFLVGPFVIQHIIQPFQA